MFLRQQYCNLFLMQYLREISHEDTLKKLVDCTSIEPAFQNLVYRLGGLQVWFSVVMALDYKSGRLRLKFSLGFMNYLAGKMQNFNLRLEKQKCSLCHCILPCRNEWWKNPDPVLNSAHYNLKPFFMLFLFSFL